MTLGVAAERGTLRQGPGGAEGGAKVGDSFPYMRYWLRDIHSDPDYTALPDPAKTLYRHLFEAQFMIGGTLPIDLDELERLAKVERRTWDEHHERVLKPPFFYPANDGLENPRAREEYDWAVSMRERGQKANAARKTKGGGRPPKTTKKQLEKQQENNKGNNSETTRETTPELPTQYSVLSTQSLKLKEEEHTLVEPPGSTAVSDPPPESESEPKYPAKFEQFWSGYPRKTSKRAALRAWKSCSHDRGLLAERSHAYGEALNAHGLARGAPHPATWIKDGRHADDPEEWVQMAARTLRMPNPLERAVSPQQAQRERVYREFARGGDR